MFLLTVSADLISVRYIGSRSEKYKNIPEKNRLEPFLASVATSYAGSLSSRLMMK